VIMPTDFINYFLTNQKKCFRFRSIKGLQESGLRGQSPLKKLVPFEKVIILKFKGTVPMSCPPEARVSSGF